MLKTHQFINIPFRNRIDNLTMTRFHKKRARDSYSKAQVFFHGISIEEIENKFKDRDIKFESRSPKIEINFKLKQEFSLKSWRESQPKFLEKLYELGLYPLTQPFLDPHIKSIEFYFDENLNAQKICEELKKIHFRGQYIDAKPLLSQIENNEKLTFENYKDNLKKPLIEVMGDTRTDKLFGKIDSNVERYKSLKGWHNPIMKTSNQDLIEEETIIKNKTIQLLQKWLEIVDYFQKIDTELKLLETKYSLRKNEEDDEQFENMYEDYEEIKKNVLESTLFETNGNIYESKELLLKLLHDCYSYELKKCESTSLNDWLDNESLLTTAITSGMLRKIRIGRLFFGISCLNCTE